MHSSKRLRQVLPTLKVIKPVYLLALLAVLTWLLARPSAEPEAQPIAGLDPRLNYAVRDFSGRLLDDAGFERSVEEVGVQMVAGVLGLVAGEDHPPAPDDDGPDQPVVVDALLEQQRHLAALVEVEEQLVERIDRPAPTRPRRTAA